MAKSERRAPTVKQRVLLAFMIFTIIMLLAFWVLELFCFDPIFASYKRTLISHDVDTIARNIDANKLDALVERIARTRKACIVVVDSEGNILVTAEARANCRVHGLSSVSLKEFYALATDSSSGFTESYEDIPYGDGYNASDYEGSVPAKSDGLAETVIHGKSVVKSDGTRLAIIEDASLEPEAAIKSTVAMLLSVISVVAVVIAVIFGIRVSRNVSAPIEKLSRMAGDITAGNVDETEKVKASYREIEDLSAALTLAGKEVSEVDKYRKELIANVGHDLRTPLTLIRGYAELMRDIPSEATAENLQVIIDESSRLSGLVQDVLDLSKEQDSADVLKAERYDIVASIDELIKRHSKLIEHLGYTIEWEHDKEAFVYADEAKMTQVVYNLINNAVNYCGEDKNVVVKEYLHGDNVRIEVTDKGEGIDVSILPHIWDRYYKSDKSHKRATVGTGLGLSIVKSVMNRHPGGVYGVITSVGEGSTFYVELPRME